MGREILRLTTQVLEDWLELCYSDLPEGFKVTGARVDNFNKTVEFIVEHRDLEEPPEGSEPDARMIELACRLG